MPGGARLLSRGRCSCTPVAALATGALATLTPAEATRAAVATVTAVRPLLARTSRAGRLLVRVRHGLRREVQVLAQVLDSRVCQVEVVELPAGAPRGRRG